MNHICWCKATKKGWKLDKDSSADVDHVFLDYWSDDKVCWKSEKAVHKTSW